MWALIQKRKIDDATFADKITETAKKWLAQYEQKVSNLESRLAIQQEEIESLQERVSAQEKEIRLLRDGAMRLQGQVISLGQKPVFELWGEEVE